MYFSRHNNKFLSTLDSNTVQDTQGVILRQRQMAEPITRFAGSILLKPKQGKNNIKMMGQMLFDS